MPEVGKNLFQSWWKNTPNVYLSPQTHYRGSQVPSLVWFCLHCISEFSDQIQLPTKLIYRPQSSPPPESFCLIDRLLHTAPSKGSNYSELDLRKLDPRLWVTVIQIFDQIPSKLRTYTLSLNDDLLPLIQGLKNTDTFSLITILELPGCDALTDNSVTELRCLHTLSALDASNTRLSSRGIMTFAWTLSVNDPEEPIRKLRGPWGLRILRLKHCAEIDNAVYRVLSSFPLLAVIDLRGTKCRPLATGSRMPFSPSKERKLFSSDLSSSLGALQKLQPDVRMFSAPEEYQFILRIKSLCHESVASVLQHSLDQAPTSSTNSRHDDICGYEYDPPYRNNFGSDVDDDELSSECTHQAEGEEDEWNGNAAQRLWKPSRNISKLDSPMQLRTASKLSPMVTNNNRSSAHQTSQKDFYSRERPLKRFKLSTLTSTLNSLENHSRMGCLEKASEGNSGPEDEILTEPGIRPPRRRGLHWYDADLQRANTYVPMSLARGGYDDILMLYRPFWPWCHLEEKLLEKEIQSEKARLNQTGTVLHVSVLGTRHTIKAQEGLQSMTALALQRRQEQIARNRNEPSRKSSENLFSNKLPQSSISQPARAAPLKVQKSLKPITALKVPKFTQEILEKNKPAVPTSKDLEAQETTLSTMSTCRKAKSGNIATENMAWGLLTSPSTTGSAVTSMTSMDREKEYPERRGVCSFNPASSTSSSISPNTVTESKSSSRPGKPNNSRGAFKNTEGSRFNWEAWASKRS